MDTINKTFYDVEHGGDIDEIKSVIHNNGGSITHERFEYDAEMLELTWTVPDRKAFWEAVKGTYYFN
jgi:hypothetical protein